MIYKYLGLIVDKSINYEITTYSTYKLLNPIEDIAHMYFYKELGCQLSRDTINYFKMADTNSYDKKI